MPEFFRIKRNALAGDSYQVQLICFGASREVGGVTITALATAHVHAISSHKIAGDLGKMLNDSGLTVNTGPPKVYDLTFKNGSTFYLSDDTGSTAEQKTVIVDHYR